MLMHNPPHPGKVVKRALIEGTCMAVPEAAKALGVRKDVLAKLLKCKSNITPEMAVRLSIALNTSSEMWLNMQSMYDLYQVEKHRRNLKVTPIIIKFATT